MVAKSPRQGSVAKFKRDLRSGVDGYRLKEEEYSTSNEIFLTDPFLLLNRPKTLTLFPLFLES